MNIQEAELQYKAAAKNLTDTIAKVYPVGSVIDVEIGNATIRVEVTGYSNWSHEPTRIFGKNIKTGKDRHFWPFQIVESE